MSHGAAHADPSDPFQMRVAVAMALITVVVAFNGMLTNQARTEALLLSNEATNQWAYFQAKSTKAAIVRATRDIVDQLPGREGAAPAGTSDKLKAEAERYDREKEEIKVEADKITAEGKHQQHREHYFEYATTIAEVALVLASVALLMASKNVFRLSVAVAAAALVVTGYTALH